MAKNVKSVRVFFKPESKIVFDNKKTKSILQTLPYWFVQGDLRKDKIAVIYFTNKATNFTKKGIPYVRVVPGKYQISYYNDKIIITKLDTFTKTYTCLVFPISRKAYLFDNYTIVDSVNEKHAINIYFDKPMKYKKVELNRPWYKYVFEEDISTYFLQAKMRIKS